MDQDGGLGAREGGGLLQGEDGAKEEVLHSGILAQHLSLVHLHQAWIDLSLVGNPADVLELVAVFMKGTGLHLVDVSKAGE
jgi:hypothetical protein